MSVLKRNIVANFGGNVWSGAMNIIFVPLYIHVMGAESYGLVGIFATLQTMVVILDMGLSATLTREMARLSVQQGKEQEMRNLVRSLEIIYWCVAAFIGIAITAIAPYITNQWVKAGQLSPQTIEQALRIMGFAMALQFPASFYSGGLMGLQKQVLLNAINIGVSTLRGAGAVLILWLISPTIQAFFLWQIIISIINTCLLAFFLWHKLPHTEKKIYFQKQLFAGIWQFAVGMSGITITGLFISQVDKILLSKLLTLEEFGYYSFAALAASSIAIFVRPVYLAVFPRFSGLVSLRDEIELKQLYHKSSQFLAVLILPPAIVLAFFSYEILLFWTGNPITVMNTYFIVRLLAIGATLNGLLHIPYALVLSYGWTSLSLYVHIIAIIVLVPMITFLTTRYGVVGAPIGWIIYNSCNILITTHIMHLRLLKREKWQWYLNGVGKPLAVALIVAFLWRITIPTVIGRVSILLLICGVLLTILSATAIVTPYTRSWIMYTLNGNKIFLKLKNMREAKTDA
ncbi:lipopolysaccharide biosynthesis protein [Thermodesulfobacteriota bacterium]